ncbi:hypothetical protein B0T16DRAFT_59574 [Cercophora newfieldiana]|uniref:Uncharacterized protein n=1 Tax=Cercophora newfieldiana TaxID=92897 RepID=A0AA39YRN3_9PEZI|nr:hypothetical protein B0T16DRAFT_59574 [Cercophora newfieldiana]
MAAPLRPPLGLPSPHPDGSDDPYFEDQWSDDPGDEHDEAHRRRTRTHNISSRTGRSPFMPSGQGARGETVPYGRPTPQRADTEPFPPASGLRTRPYTGYYGPPPPSRTPFTPRETYATPTGGYTHGPDYYPSGYGTSYTTAPPPETIPYSSHPYPSTPADPSYGYTSPYQSSTPQPFGTSYNDGRTGVRGPTIRVRKTQVEPQPEPLPRLRREDIEREREREAAEKRWRESQRQKQRSEKEAERKEREATKRDLDRLRRDKLKLKVERLQQQLKLERSRQPTQSDFEPSIRPHDLIDYLHTLREQETRRSLVERPDSVTRLLQDIAEIADAKREAQTRQERLHLLGGLPVRARSRSSFGDVSHEISQRRLIEEVMMDILRGGALDEDVSRLPLPARSHHTGRSGEDIFPEDDFLRMPRTYQDEDSGASPRSRYSDAHSDAHVGTSSPRHRTGDPGPSIMRDRDPYLSPEPSRYGRHSVPPLERRQTAPPPGLTPIRKVSTPGSSKRPRGSDFSSDHSLAADRGEYTAAAYDRRAEVLRRTEQFAEQYQDQDQMPQRAGHYREEPPLRREHFQNEPPRPERPRDDTPRRMDADWPDIRRADSHRSSGTRKSSMSVPRPARSPERRRDRSRVAFREQDPAGGRPIIDDTSESESGGRLRREGSYRIAGDRVSGRRYNPRDATPPHAPEAPRSETPTVTGSARPPRRPQVEDDWSDDDGGRFMSRESTVGR